MGARPCVFRVFEIFYLVPTKSTIFYLLAGRYNYGAPPCIPQNDKMDGLWEKAIEMDDLGVPAFMETFTCELRKM